jgi:hypothetical protein
VVRGDVLSQGEKVNGVLCTEGRKRRAEVPRKNEEIRLSSHVRETTRPRDDGQGGYRSTKGGQIDEAINLSV